MIMIMLGIIGIVQLQKVNAPEGTIIAIAILAGSSAIMDGLWNIKIVLNEIKDIIKHLKESD